MINQFLTPNLMLLSSIRILPLTTCNFKILVERFVDLFPYY